MSASLIGGHLFESAAARRSAARPALVSLLVHSGLISVAVWLAVDPRSAKAARPEETAIVELAAFRPPPAPAVGAPTPKTPPPRGFQILAAPADLPTELPKLELTKPVTIPEDFTGVGVAGGVGVVAAPLSAGGPRASDPLDGNAVDQPPFLLPGQMGPVYPEMLRNDAPDGVVVVRFVVDTLGRVEQPTLAVVRASNPLFFFSVQTALDHLRFSPARFSGQRVRVRMEQRFEFHLANR